MTTMVKDKPKTNQKKTDKKAPAKKESEKKAAVQEGTVNVITLDRIVLSPKWTGKLGLHKGDSVKIRFENSSLILSKPV